MNKKIKIFILASIMFNALLVGIIIGYVSRRKIKNAPTPIIKANIAIDKETSIRERLQNQPQSDQDDHHKIEVARLEAIRILHAPKFDEKAYQAQVDRLHELRGKLMQKNADVVKQLAVEFNQTERQALVNILLERPPESRHKPPRRRKPHHDHPSRHRKPPPPHPDR